MASDLCFMPNIHELGSTCNRYAEKKQFLDKPKRHLVFSENGKAVVHHQVERSANFVDSLSEENGMAYN